MENFISALLLPVFVLLVLGAIGGVKPEVILKPIFDLVGVLLKVMIETIGLIVRLTVEAVVLAIAASRQDARFKNAGAQPKPQKIKVTVVEDQE